MPTVTLGPNACKSLTEVIEINDMTEKNNLLYPFRARITGVLILTLTLTLSQSHAASAPNILLLIGDDMGIETLPCYGIAKDTPSVPTLNDLCRLGTRFTNVWSQPVCSPTRATMLTGRYGFRTGVGSAIPAPKEVASLRVAPPKPASASRESPVTEHEREVPGLRPNEFTLPMALKSNSALGYETAAIGKWHLADLNNGGFNHPNRAGFDYFSGDAFGPLPSYFAYPTQLNGKPTQGVAGYADSTRVDDALAWIRSRSGNKPWFLWLGFSNPHSPYHLPPTHLLHSAVKELDPLSNDINQKPFPYFKAMLEALDTEIGRLLNSLTAEQRANTYIVFVGDNGTSRAVVQAPFDPQRSKGTVYQGGVNVPLVVVGPGIQGGRISTALINTTDIYATILELATIDIKRAVPASVKLDSVSFASLLHKPEATAQRSFAYTESFGPGIKKAQAIRNQSYKLVINEANEELFALSVDPYEQQNLMSATLSAEARKNYDGLKTQLNQLLSTEQP